MMLFIFGMSTAMINNDIVGTFDEIVTKYGYQFEKHDVITKDGYILTLFRIPGRLE